MSNSQLQIWPLTVGIEPKTKADQEKLSAALSKLAAEDPSFGASTDVDSGQTILKGMDEFQLDTKIDILRCTYDVDLHIGPPEVAYRETPTKPVDIDYTYKTQTGGRGEFARVKLRVEPDEPGAGFLFRSSIVGDAAPKAYVSGVENGLQSVMAAGVVAGFPVVDVKVELVDFAYHDVDSSALAFEIAARAAFREALRKSGAVLLEPIMKIEVVTPEAQAGPIIGDLISRRSHVLDRSIRNGSVLISAMAPLANMFGFANVLRAKFEGATVFSMTFSRYAPVSPRPDDDPSPAAPAMALRV